jgi:16S rRNA (guanine527-N7)-methyltransferase
MDDLLDALFNLTGRTLTPGQVQAFEVYENELCAWNQNINLTAIRDRKAIRVKHFLDSLTCLPMLGEMSEMKLMDIGTGAGFPGIPIKICEPAVMVVLTDSVGKKLDFCRHIIEKLYLNGIPTIQARAEDLGQSLEHREQYDRATARAVASMPVLVEYLLPLLKIGGKAVIQKGENGPLETQEAKRAIKVLGGELELISPVNLPGIAETRYLITIRKITSTPKGYPRRAGIPAGKPIL